MKSKLKYILGNVGTVIFIILYFSYYYFINEFEIGFFTYMLLNSIGLIGGFFIFIITLFFVPSELIIELFSLIGVFLNFIIYLYILNILFNNKKINTGYIFTFIFIIINLLIGFGVFL